MPEKKDRGTGHIDVAYVARLARLLLDESEERLFQAQLADIVGYVGKVGEPDVAGVEPTAHGVPVHSVLRADEARESDLRSLVMANAPASREGHFLVPKIVE